MGESNVRVALDGLGKFIRTVQNTISGTLEEQQVVTLADSSGNLLDTQLANLNLSLTALRDAITASGASAKTLADVVTTLQGTLKENITQVSGVTLNGQIPVNNAPLFDTGVLGDGLLGAQIIAAPALYTELVRIRQGISLLLTEFSSKGVDLTKITATEAI